MTLVTLMQGLSTTMVTYANPHLSMHHSCALSTSSRMTASASLKGVSGTPSARSRDTSMLMSAGLATPRLTEALGTGMMLSLLSKLYASATLSAMSNLLRRSGPPASRAWGGVSTKHRKYPIHKAPIESNLSSNREVSIGAPMLKMRCCKPSAFAITAEMMFRMSCWE